MDPHQRSWSYRDARIIAIDIDGTLTTSSGRITPRTVESVRRAAEAGIEVVIATGRRQAFAMPVLEPLGLGPETVLITSNGSVTRTLSGSLLDRTLMPAATARRICSYLAEFTDSMVFTFDVDGPGSLVVESKAALSRSLGRWVDVNGPAIVEMNPIAEAFAKGEEPIQGMVAGSLARMRQVRERLESGSEASRVLSLELAVHRTDYPERDLAIVDLLPAGCSKGIALERLARIRGVAREEVVAIGDNWNDMEMLLWAGQPIVMGNAAGDLLNLAGASGWRVTASNEEDGVALAIEGILASRMVESTL